MLQSNRTRSINIDVLKGIAIIAVVLYHANGKVFSNGYLGVDIFFVIGGFFMMKGFLKKEQFNFNNLLAFLWNRIIRLCPLIFLLSGICLVISYFAMLPDDLENMTESAVATNFFANNVLACITTKNYWDVVNEYKPLMHTWYIGVLMQAYVAFAVLYYLYTKIAGFRLSILSKIILSIAIISLILFLLPGFSTAAKFYYLPFRAFELMAGAYVAISLREGHDLKKIKDATVYYGAFLLAFALLILLFCPAQLLPNSAKLILTVIITAVLLFLYADTRCCLKKNPLTSFLAFIGMASFSIYLWHQPELALGRYCLFSQWNIIAIIAFIGALIILSAISYFFIEKKLQNIFTSTKRQILMAVFLLIAFSGITFFGCYLYFCAGIVRDVPELGISIKQRARGIHSEYNSRVYSWDKDFTQDSSKIKVLVVGNSFGRDWANILEESQYHENFEISYIYPYNPEYVDQRKHRFQQADYIFVFGTPEETFILFQYPQDRLYGIGTKDFGASMGYIYVHRFSQNYFKMRAVPNSEVMTLNKKLRQRYKDKYIDLISCVIDKDGKVPVFTPDHKIISQDCRHLTKFGAQFYASILDIKRFTQKP